MAEQLLERDSDLDVNFWDDLTGTDTGERMRTPNGVLAGTVQLIDTGSFAGTVTLQGTLDGSNWVALSDVEGTSIAFTGEALHTFAAVVSAVRVACTGVTGTAQVRIKTRAA